MFANILLFAFLACTTLSFAACKNNVSNKNNTSNTPAGTEAVLRDMGVEEFERIISNKNGEINDYLLVDVRHTTRRNEERKSFEYQKGHTFCGISIPFDEVTYDVKKNDPNFYSDEKKFDDELVNIFNYKLINNWKDKNVIVQCNTKGRSPEVAKILQKKGFKKLFVVFGVKGYDEKPKSEPRTFDKQYRTRIPAILRADIAKIQGVKVLDVRPKNVFDSTTHYNENGVEAQNVPSEKISEYSIARRDRIVVMAANAFDAFKAADKLYDKLKSNGFVLGETDLLEQIRICVEPAR